MGKTTFGGPMRSGKKDVAVGQVVLQQWVAIAHDDFGSAFNTGITLPAGARIVEMWVEETTSWNGARTLEIGDGTDADEFGDITDLSASDKVVATQSAAQRAVSAPLAAEATLVLTGGGSAGSAGEGFFVVSYIQDHNDPQL